MKLLSITVPCYNSQEYMRKCVDSLLTGGKLVEILIVDDGSSDDTGKIADDAFIYFFESRIWLLIACVIGSTPLPKMVCTAAADRLKDKEILLSVIETSLLMGIFILSMAFLVSGSYNPFLYFRF